MSDYLTALALVTWPYLAGALVLWAVTRWERRPHCPHCGSRYVVRGEQAMGEKTWECDCGYWWWR